jgi:hypothetical protein
MKRRRLAFRIVLPMLSVAAVLQAQAYGTGSQSTMVPAAAFRGRSTGDPFSSDGATVTPTAGNSSTMVAPIQLPNGAILESVRLLLTSNDPFNFTGASVRTFGFGTATAVTCGPDTVWSGSVGTSAGQTTMTLTGTPLEISAKTFCTQDEAWAQYFIEANLPSEFVSLSGAVLIWHRQVKAAPLGQTFDDVPPNDPFFRAIEALAASGITTGCGGNNFCPNDVVTRNQLAKFLANALGLHFPSNGGFSP